MKHSTKLIQIATVGKPHGLQGFFYCKTSYPLEESTTLFLGKSQKVVSVKAVKDHKGKTIVQLAEFHDRTALEPFVGMELWAPETEKTGLDLFIDKPVYDLQGQVLGTISEFYNCGAGDVIVIANDQGQTLELPYNSVYFNVETAEKEPLTLKECPSKFADLWQ